MHIGYTKWETIDLMLFLCEIQPVTIDLSRSLKKSEDMCELGLTK